MSSAAVAGSARPPGLIEVELSIRGMTCAACAARGAEAACRGRRRRSQREFRHREGRDHGSRSVSVARLIDSVEQARYGGEAVRPGAAAAFADVCLIVRRFPGCAPFGGLSLADPLAGPRRQPRRDGSGIGTVAVGATDSNPRATSARTAVSVAVLRWRFGGRIRQLRLVPMIVAGQ